MIWPSLKLIDLCVDAWGDNSGICLIDSVRIRRWPVFCLNSFFFPSFAQHLVVWIFQSDLIFEKSLLLRLNLHKNQTKFKAIKSECCYLPFSSAVMLICLAGMYIYITFTLCSALHSPLFTFSKCTLKLIFACRKDKAVSGNLMNKKL